jgi:L-iditol 2-dehydrogenase
MKALQTIYPRTFREVQAPIPQLPIHEKDYILVRTAWGLTCGSDIPFFIGNKRHQSYPLLPGAPIHECSGEVVESSSEQFHPGDRVLAIPEGNLGLAEYFLAQTDKTIILDPKIDDLGAACIIQPLSTVMNAVDRLGDIQGKSVAVVGLGPIGLLFCWLARKRGAGSVAGIDPLIDRCRVAETLGAAKTFCCRGAELIHQTRAVPNTWNAASICIEAVGHQMNTLNDCFELVEKLGTVLAFGVPDQPVYALEYETFFRKNAVLIAAVTPDWKEYLLKAQNLFLENRIELSRLITHRLPMREAEKAFGMYERRDAGVLKVALDARGW